MFIDAVNHKHQRMVSFNPHEDDHDSSLCILQCTPKVKKQVDFPASITL